MGTAIRSGFYCRRFDMGDTQCLRITHNKSMVMLLKKVRSRGKG